MKSLFALSLLSSRLATGDRLTVNHVTQVIPRVIDGFSELSLSLSPASRLLILVFAFVFCTQIVVCLRV